MSRRTWTLRTKWTLGVCVVAVVPMVVLGLAVLDIQRSGLSRAEKELELAVVDEAATSVARTLDQASDVASRATAIFADEEIGVEARSRILGDIVRRAPATSGISFFDEEHHFVDAVVPKSGGVDESLLVPPAGLGFRVVTRGEGAPALRYESELRGPIRGYIVVGLAEGALGDRLRDVSLVRFGAPDRVYLVDESHLVLGGGKAGTRPSLPIFAAATSPLESFTKELVLTTEFRDGGIEKVGTIRTLPSQRWAVVVERPTSEAFAALTSARRAFLASLGIFALAAAIAGALFARRALAPVGSLMRLIERYAKRDFDARSDVRSGDELESLGTSLERMADDLASSEIEIAKRARAIANLSRYMPAPAAEAVAEGDTLDLGGKRRRVTVIFADVAAFSSFAEKASPERAVAFLNELFTILSEIVFRHGGMVDKFIGDCIMAVFRPAANEGGDEIDEGDDVARAVAATQDMHSFVESNLPRWRDEFSFTVELGIGIATGEVLMGNLGSTERMEYTVIGDAVNIAARLEALAGPRKTLATGEVVAACPDVDFVSLGAQPIRGREQAVEVFEVAS